MTKETTEAIAEIVIVRCPCNAWYAGIARCERRTHPGDRLHWTTVRDATKRLITVQWNADADPRPPEPMTNPQRHTREGDDR